MGELALAIIFTAMLPIVGFGYVVVRLLAGIADELELIGDAALGQAASIKRIADALDNATPGGVFDVKVR